METTMSDRLAEFAWLGILVAAVGCGGEGTPEPAGPAPAGDSEVLVYTVNYPLQYMAGRIGGDRVRVEFPVPGDVDPAFWSPEPDLVAEYQEADLILLNGAGYAKWVERVALPSSKLVDTSRSFSESYVEVADAATHSHGPQGVHSHGEIAFTTWLDPTLAVEQARAILDALVAARPAHEAQFRAAFEALESDLLELDREIEALVSKKPDLPLLASHPVYQYLARRYGLDVASVHFEPDEMPDEKAWRGLREILDDHPAGWMLWEGEPLEETRQELAALGVENVVYDPCGSVPESGDFLTVARANVERLRNVFR
jgi:zinc transport system substrate-binding protein